MEFITTLLQDGYTWYTFSFLIFAFIILKLGGPVINAALDTRIDGIKKDLDEAENLRIEAQEMLAQYQRKQRDATEESEKIIATARESADAYIIKAEGEIKELMARREEQLNDRLKHMEQNAINEIQSYAADLAMKAANQIIIDTLDKNINEKLVKESIANVEANIH